ncbi:MAG: alpha/beta hydrolase family protein [Acidobacteria bacterium]|nr:alpha/beta hydrolase family protein [Acidobacteriota bacterium]
MLSGRYRQWMYDWETRLTSRDTNRVVRPLQWGEEWAGRWPLVNGDFAPGAGSAERVSANVLADLNRRIVAHSDQFFSYRAPADFRLETGQAARSKDDRRLEPAAWLRFTSPVETPYPENNIVTARWFPAAPGRSGGRPAVVVLPQWNSDAWGHNGLCRILSRFGISCLRLSMPYHDVRMPAELERADYAVSANISRTIDAGRQAVIDIRCCLDWLQQQGSTDLGILGTSLGSCYAFLASAHDERLRVNAFNHASNFFGDVVWTGQSTRHVRAGMEPEITREQLREAWLGISPKSYFDKFARWPKKSLVVYARYDLSFLPELSRDVVEEFRRWSLDFRSAVLPCGHYTTGEAPFKYLDAWHLTRFLYGALRQ